MSTFPPALSDVRRYPGFTCFKSIEPIHYPRRWQRDALIQAALDPSVSAMGTCEDGLLQVPQIEFAFKVVIAGSAFAFVVTDSPRHSFEGFAHPLLRVPRRALLTEPLHSTCKAVWARKRLLVDPHIKYRAIEIAGSKVEGVSLHLLLHSLGSYLPKEPLDPILAMLAQGVLVGELGFGLHTHTMFRVGPSYADRRDPIPVARLRALLHPG